MEQPAKIDLHTDRWVACIRELAFVGFDFTSATFAAQVRTVPDAAGSPLVNLGTVGSLASEGVMLLYGGSATIADHIAAGRIDEVPTGYVSTDVVLLSSVRIRINETTMEALTLPNDEDGPDTPLVWDLHITPSGGIKDKYAGGKFIVRGGATH